MGLQIYSCYLTSEKTRPVTMLHKEPCITRKESPQEPKVLLTYNPRTSVAIPMRTMPDELLQVVLTKSRLLNILAKLGSKPWGLPTVACGSIEAQTLPRLVGPLNLS